MVDFTQCAVFRFIHVAAGVTGQGVCAADLAGPDRMEKNNSKCLDPGRVERWLGGAYRQPLTDRDLHIQAGTSGDIAAMF